MTAVSQDRAVAEWLRRLKWALAAMPEADREDIVAEARSHIEEAVSSGRISAEVLAGFGPADAYARRFLDEMELAGALGAQRSGDLLRAVSRRVHRSLVAASAGLVLLVLFAVSSMALVLVIMKIGDPEHAGLWIGPNVQFLGTIDEGTQATEVLGLWAFPLAAAIWALSWLIARITLLAAVRRLARRD
jgi:uncharacterized membrane protein